VDFIFRTGSELKRLHTVLASPIDLEEMRALIQICSVGSWCVL